MYLQELLLREGLAWVYPQYCRDCAVWKAIQDAAGAEWKGLRADQNAIPPWEWRKQ